MHGSDRLAKAMRLGPTLFAVLLAGCGPSLESAYFEPQSAVETAITNHYERYASEENGQCLRPYIKGLSRIEVIEDQPERLAVQIRYLFRDRNRDNGDGSNSVCVGFSGRRFTLGKTGGEIEVVEMSGPKRREPARTEEGGP